MKIAVCAMENNTESSVDERFGRCNYFLIFENGSLLEAVENEGKNATSGAGLKAVQLLADRGVEAVYAGRFGPKAERALQETGITYKIAQGNVLDVMQKKIFVPLLDNAGKDSRIALHFGHAPYFALIKGEDIQIHENKLEHHGEISPVQQIMETASPDVVVARGIGRRAIRLFSERNVELRQAQGETLAEVMEGFDSLPSLTESCGH